jgi:hypothetical protein
MRMQQCQKVERDPNAGSDRRGNVSLRQDFVATSSSFWLSSQPTSTPESTATNVA